MELRNFQKKFVSAVESGRYDTLCLSLPRGNGKSTLAGYLLSRIVTPLDSLFVPGAESVVLASSLEQARIPFRAARRMIGGSSDYRWSDSLTRVGVVHVPTRTGIRVISSNSRSAFGLVDTPFCIADEPGAWQTAGGQQMYDAITTALGKPNSPMTAIFVGTLAPATGGWWPEMVEKGTHRRTYVQSLQGDLERWDDWNEIKKANPLTAISAAFRERLIQERDAARSDSRLKAQFCSYRLNVPTMDVSTVLLSVDDWKRVQARDVPERSGRLIVGVDLGSGRAWSAAVALWQSGRVECLAVAPGVPDIDQQERRDRVPRGTYSRLVKDGSLSVADGLRVQPPSQLMDMIRTRWGKPDLLLADRFRLADLRDCASGWNVEPRVSRWSESSADIRALRKYAMDGPLSCAVDSRSLMTASLAVATVKNDDAGNVRMVKNGSNNTARDDVAAGLVLAAGAAARHGLFDAKPRRKRRYAIV